MWKLYEIQLLVFVFKVLLEHNHYLGSIYGCFPAMWQRLSLQQKLYDPQSLKYLLSDWSWKTFADTCIRS